MQTVSGSGVCTLAEFKPKHNPIECSCSRCRGACITKPGWFLPGEAETAARFLGVEFSQFERERLRFDYCYKNGEPVKVRTPAMDEHGCTFYKRGRCEIHAAKPFECAQYDHNDTDTAARHIWIAKQWDKT